VARSSSPSTLAMGDTVIFAENDSNDSKITVLLSLLSLLSLLYSTVPNCQSLSNDSQGQSMTV
jgi:hypothetical protein